MEYYNNILCVEAGWLIEQGILTECNYKQLALRRDIKVVRRACRNRTALVDYESMPERFRRQIDSHLSATGKNARQIAQINEIESLIADSVEASDFFDRYLTPDGRHLPTARRREYYADAIVLDAIIRYKQQADHRRSTMGIKTTCSWAHIALMVQEIDRSRRPHELPSNPRSLERKCTAYKANGYASLIHKNFTQTTANAVKVANDEQESVLATLLSDPRNFDNAQVQHFYNLLATELGWKTITAAAVGVWRTKLNDVTFARRRGHRAYRNECAMQVRRKAPSAPLLYWTLDGWDAELMYQRTDAGRTSYCHRPTVVVVLDAFNRYPIGYAIGTHETPQLITAALRNALRHTAELFGTMYKTVQIQSDRYAIKTLTPLYAAAAHYVTPAEAGNAKSKIIEPWFKHLNRTYCQTQPNWSGFGVTSRKELQPNVEYLNRYKHHFPDFDGVVSQLSSIIEAERRRLAPDFIRAYQTMDHSRLLPMQQTEYLLHFGIPHTHRNLLQGSGLKITLPGGIHVYDCFDVSFRSHAATRWQIHYDPDDLTHILASSPDGSLQYILEEKYIQPMALADRTEGDADELNRIRQFNRTLDEHHTARLCTYQDTARQLIEQESARKNLETLQKLLITDDSGQHKNARNRARLADPDTPTDTPVSPLDIYDIY